MNCNCRNCKYYKYVSGEWSALDSGCSLKLDWRKCTIHNQLESWVEWEGMGQ